MPEWSNEVEVEYRVEHTVGPKGNFGICLVINAGEEADLRMHLTTFNAYKLALDLWEAVLTTQGERPC